ncbi:hypothetical protein A2348_04840 [Candidatus Uhrbacteria bacterium RIFOXYB12_FULL_58_10]|uniref:Uncharacterized protein n=1 Tax=Candidatus Uhrbacteria bacterium RIFOXYB2_FULL_57_15 TaxID=1802422 RepID=A0A1F7W9C4_9BACT|nr:MAG: hypothetical protein A2348_04840 [Candidatus Uhrbacteria bacterium RIFOXYB12_FULL_58_10]OGL98797.1 MAG: hypothetical protein A2304_04865 [Candidatus Uhrbacteria bacterium RIFOXYB2_FULL_57_15]OGL99792.1 MAG: hypothetical protein A2501_04690 [Candidatus Uhrbacteria bacterium RIFOXYC12_FULL_57_11]
MAIRIGSRLLDETPRIIVPTCPAYPNRRGKFLPVTTLKSGVSLVTIRHIPFLLRVTELIPEASVTILVASHEANDPALRRATSLSRKEFEHRIRGTIHATRKRVAEYGWNVEAITDFFPSFLACRAATIRWIGNDQSLARHIDADTLAREHFYQLFCGAETYEEKRARTTKTAAEYTCLGRHAKDQAYLIVNHTTTNLAWYIPVGVALLHHHVSVY